MSGSSELPPSHGPGGRSVFSVFGFGGSRYADSEDFDSPLESAPESFDNTVYQTVAKSQRNTGQKGKGATVTPTSPETARKMRVNMPDNSGLILQSIGGKASSGQAPPAAQPGTSEKHPTYVRRYSTPQEEAGDTFDSNIVLRKFNSSLQQSTARLTHHGAGNVNIYSNFSAYSQDDSLSSTSTSAFTQSGQISSLAPPASNLSRVQSTPRLATTQYPTHYFRHPEAESSVDSTAGALSRSIRRNQSHNDLLQVTEYATGGSGGGSSDSDRSSSHDNKSITSVSSQFQTSSSTDMPDSSDSSHHSSGFGILSRTRQFGAWLTKATDGEKVEVTKTDLNVLAPNSF